MPSPTRYQIRATHLINTMIAAVKSHGCGPEICHSCRLLMSEIMKGPHKLGPEEVLAWERDRDE